MITTRILESLLSTIVRNSRRSIHTTIVNKVPEVWQPDKKGGTYNKSYDTKSEEEEEWEKWSYRDKIKGEWKLYKEHCKLWLKETKNRLFLREFIYRPGEIDVFWRFSENPECLRNWIVTADSDHNEGYSTAKLELSQYGTGIFSGNLDMHVPRDGEVTHAGYANIKTVPFTRSFFREAKMNWTEYNHLRMRVRGDGRVYMINIGLKQLFDTQWFEMYSYVLHTRGGPYWQNVKIPFSKFCLSHKGRIQDRQHGFPSDSDSVSNIGITCSDKIPGSFRLEIDYIGCEFDPSFIENCAYEMYQCDSLRF